VSAVIKQIFVRIVIQVTAINRELMMDIKLNIILIFLVTSLLSCGTDNYDTGENFGDLLDSPSDLVLIEEEHSFGWGRSDCYMCHNLNNIHLEDRTDINLDMEDIQDMTFEGDEETCQICHGDNGSS
jgi:hypothetical protein